MILDLGFIIAMNIHHLELFYYVAKYEGITAAVRKMPFGIQQPAVSGQVIQLEDDLGVKLFNRRPFALTPEGEELYDFIYPFFSQVDHLGARLRGEEGSHLRIAAAASYLRHHLPDLLEQMRIEDPKLRLTLREVTPALMHGLLTSQQVDLAVTSLYGRLGEGLQVEKLLELPLVLLVPNAWPVKRFEDLFTDDPDSTGQIAKYPLVGLPKEETISMIFQDELAQREVNWMPSVETDALDVIEEYAARGFGVGLGVEIPEKKTRKGLRVIRLEDFPPLVVAAVYQSDLKPVAQAFLERAKALAGRLAQGVGKK